ncbi:response regulator [Halalkaliarchaeum sp. AArc-GB]|uniref:response regulator transcription factor n=1 Tax=Halalkaliarchaeum sp. AArc-GB TaxID=3074078 RepID=UPI00285A37C7|nr:response regulator [Halalkaliarchaeum sp. AArc-GB]MDR5673053.1 response regulator [Halalkaliarchaeum sp. AArc-GB]
MTHDIVIADDDETIREIVEFKLDGPDRSVTAFENGRECWEHLESNGSPNLIVLDVMMPGLTGLQVLERIREDDDLSSVPVIMLTSRGREEHVVEGFERGATDYMTKPFSPNELVARVNSRLR